MTSGCFPFSALLGSTVDTCYVRLRRLFGFHTAGNCGVSTVAVSRRSWTFPSLRRGRSSWSRLFGGVSLLCLSCSLLVVSRRAENCGFHSCSSCLVVYMPVVVHDKFGVFFRAVYTGTRPGLSPAIMAGKGWRGRRELALRCSATRIRCMHRRLWIYIVVVYHRPNHHHHNAFLFGDLFANLGGRHERTRRSRCKAAGATAPLMAEAERMTVAMALAEQLHHSVNRVERDETLRRQTTRAREEEEVHEKHDGQRAQKRPLPGTRPAPLAEVAGPQVRAGMVGYMLASVPRLAGHRLQGDGGIDGTALRLLVRNVIRHL